MNQRLPLEIEFARSPCCNARFEAWTILSDYPLQRCTGCGSGYVNPRPSLDNLKEYYAQGGHGRRTASSVKEVIDAENRYPNSTVDARRILSIVAGLAPGDRLLDVGCGYGFYAAEAMEQGFQVDALEVSEFERRCTRKLAGIDPHPVTFEEFSPEPNSYDAILMSQILEHVVDPRAWVDKASGILAAGGILAVALPNFDSFVRLLLGTGDPLIQPPDHLNYFNREGLVRLLTIGPLSVVATHSISRLPGSSVTARVPVPERLQRSVEDFFHVMQRPFLGIADALGFGMFLNVYAVREA